MRLEQRLQDVRGFELVGVGLVRGIEIGRGDQRGEDRRLHVIGVARGDLAHGGIESHHSLSVRRAGVVAHEGTDRIDIVALPLRL